MKTILHSPFCILHSPFAFLAAVTLLATSPRAPAQTFWGNALSFDGVDDYVNVAAVPLADSSFTLEAWARRQSTVDMDFLLGQGVRATSAGLHFGFHMGSVFVLGFYNDDLFSAETYTNTDWHHWAGTYDASTKLRCLYRDGMLIASNTASANYQGTGPLYIGNLPFAGDTAFHGGIDDVRIWSVARSRAEIAAHAFHPLTGTESNLLAYWKFDETNGTTIYDLTPNHHDGYLVNGATRVASSVPTAPPTNRVLTIYFAGTGATLDWVTNSGWSDAGTGELLASLYTLDESEVNLNSPASTHYKLWVNGIGTGTGAVEDILASLCVSDLPVFQERGWLVCLQEAENALRTVLNTHPGENLTLNLVGWSRGGVLTMWMARSATEMADRDRVSKINILAFDPVPGVCINTMQALLGQFVLTEPEMRGHNIVSLSAKVNQFVGIYAQDERSYKFEPVIPYSESSHTKTWRFRVRGSHETLVGNTQVNGHHSARLFPTIGIDGTGLLPVSAISRAIAQELLISSEWGAVPFAPAHLWSRGYADPESLLKEYIDKMNENGGPKYNGMRGTSTTGVFSTYDRFHLFLWKELLCTFSGEVEASRLCYVAPYYTVNNVVNHERVFWLDEQFELINRETAWDRLRSLAGPTVPILTFLLNDAGGLELSWDAAGYDLEVASAPSGNWLPVTGASSPFITSKADVQTTGARFFRLHQRP